MSSNPLETYSHAGVEVTLLFDPDPEHADPRDADNLCEMYISYRGHDLGDHQLPHSGLPTIACPACEGDGGGEDPDCRRCGGLGEVEPTLAEWLTSKEAIAAMPLFIYEHGGLAISGGQFFMLRDSEIGPGDTASTDRFVADAAGWDTSFAGVVFATDAGIERLCGDGAKYRQPSWLAEAFESEIAEYDRYLQGDVFAFIAGADTPFEDSCWGFIGLDYARGEANRAAEAVSASLKSEELERTEWAARDVETIEV